MIASKCSSSVLCNQVVLFLHLKFTLCDTIARNAHFLGVQKYHKSVFSVCNWEICVFPFPRCYFLWQVYIYTERDIFQCNFFKILFVKKGNNWNLYSRQLSSISSPLTLLPSICSVVGTSSHSLTLLYHFITEHIIWNEERKKQLTYFNTISSPNKWNGNGFCFLTWIPGIKSSAYKGNYSGLNIHIYQEIQHTHSTHTLNCINARSDIDQYFDFSFSSSSRLPMHHHRRLKPLYLCGWVHFMQGDVTGMDSHKECQVTG